MKKTLLFLLVSLVLVAMTACEAPEGTAPTTERTTTTTNSIEGLPIPTESSTSATQATDNNDGTSTTKNEPITPVTPNRPVEYDPSTTNKTTTTKSSTSAKPTTTSTTKAPSMSSKENLKALFHADKSGHYDGSTYSASDRKWYDAIFDRTGEATYVCSAGEEIFQYGNGYFISQKDDVYYLKKANGKEITSSKKLNVSGFGLSYKYTDFSAFLADGYVLVFNAKESYNGTTYEVGILNTAGEWVVPLSTGNPLLSSGMTPSIEEFTENLSYVGDGCICVSVRKNDYAYKHAIYNIESNKMLYYTMPDGGYGYNLDYMITEIEFKNGVSYDNYNTGMYEFHTDGSFKYYEYSPDNISAKYGFYVDEKGVIYSMGSDGWGTVLSSSKDGKLRDFKDDDNINITDISYSYSGEWLIVITNNEGTNYYTIVDHTGDFLFEPIKTTATYITTTDGLWLGDTRSQDGIVIDKKGNILYRSKYKSNVGGGTALFVQNGIVRENGEDEHRDVYDKYTRL